MIIVKSKRKHPCHTEKTISTLEDKLKKRGIKSKVIILENLEVFLDENKVLMKTDNWIPSKSDHVFFRIAEKYKNASYILSRYLRLKKIPYIDNYHSFTRERNKLIQMFLLAINGINMPKTYYSPTYDLKKIRKATRFLGFPVVIKLTNKERGEGVFLAKNNKELLQILKINKGEEIILQEFIDNSFDYRILVLGNKVKLGEKRTRTSKNDFRNNVSQGAKEEFIGTSMISDKIKKISEKSSRIMDIQVCGVDVIEARNGEPYVIEANFSPSFTLNDNLSNELNYLADYLKKWSEKK